MRRDGEVPGIHDRLRADEERAARLLVQVIPGVVLVIPRDVGGANATHDFDLQLADRSIISVEVTSNIDPDIRRQHAELTKRQWDFGCLKHGWLVTLQAQNARQGKIGDLFAELPGLLAKLEARGDQVFAASYLDRDVGKPFIRLRVLEARVDAQCPSGHVSFVLQVSRSSSPDDIRRAALDAVMKSDNVAKLAGAGGAEKHLVVLADPLSSSVAADIVDTHWPGETLRRVDVPVEVDVLWVMGFRRAWRFDRRNGWQHIEIRQVLAGPPSRGG